MKKNNDHTGNDLALRMANVSLILDEAGITSTLQQRVFMLCAQNAGKSFLEAMDGHADVADSTSKTYRRYYYALRKLMGGCQVRKDGLDLFLYGPADTERWHRPIFFTVKGKSIWGLVSKELGLVS